MLNVLHVVSMSLSALASLAVIIGVLFAIRTFWNERAMIELERARISTELMVRFDEKLDEYKDIIEYLDSDDPDINPIDSFGANRVEALIGIYETIGQLANDGLMSLSIVENDFSYSIERISRNEKIMDYIDSLRKSDSSLYENFIRLCAEFEKRKE